MGEQPANRTTINKAWNDSGRVMAFSFEDGDFIAINARNGTMGLKLDFPTQKPDPSLPFAPTCPIIIFHSAGMSARYRDPHGNAPDFRLSIRKIIGRAPCPPSIWRSGILGPPRGAHQRCCPRSGRRPHLQQTLHQEARIIGKLGHPHIVTIFDAGNLDDVYYIAMEYLEGGTLKERIKAGLTPDQAVTILCQIARALGRAHQQHCIHRDIAGQYSVPAIQTRRCYRFRHRQEHAGQDSVDRRRLALGTPITPGEQALAKPTDARSDLYNLGVVFYEMLTGTQPFQGRRFRYRAEAASRAGADPAGTARPAFQPAIDRLLAKESEGDSPAPRWWRRSRTR